MTNPAFQANATAAGFTPEQSIYLAGDSRAGGSLDGSTRARSAERSSSSSRPSRCLHLVGT
eukprot:6454897-Amphidinium_carterae.3